MLLWTNWYFSIKVDVVCVVESYLMKSMQFDSVEVTVEPRGTMMTHTIILMDSLPACAAFMYIVFCILRATCLFYKGLFLFSHGL